MLFIALLSVGNEVFCQELEPRRWSHLPTGINFVGLGTAYTFGDIFFNPALQIEDSDVKTMGIAAAYIRTFDMFGKSARIDMSLPYAEGRWEGLLAGEPAQTDRKGLGDSRLRLSVNLLGAPPLKGKAFAGYRAENPVSTTAGAAVAVTLPTGEYHSEQLINLGGNRWVIRPQMGVLHQRHKWQFELTGSVFLFGDNKDFWMERGLKQDPLWFIQGHAVYTFRPGLWASLSTGYAHGGRSHVAGLPLDDDSRLSYWKISVGVPITPRQGLNFSFAAGRTNTRNDGDLYRLAMGWSMMFGH
jgi:hypothetical protein